MKESETSKNSIGTLYRGEVVLLFAFDVASEIATERIGELMKCTPTRLTLRMDRTVPKSVPLYRPLEIEPKLNVSIAGRPAGVLVRVYDVGVVTVTLRIPIEFADLQTARPFHTLSVDDGRTVEVWASGVCTDLCRELKTVMTRPGLPSEPEAYTVFCLTDLGGANDTTAWLDSHRREVAGLLADTPAERLSDTQIEETLSLRRTFERGDLVVMSWDAALVVDLNGFVDDELYVLEMANLQLVEFRVLDQFLDKHLTEAYTDLEQRSWPAWGRVPAVLKRLRRWRVDLTQLTDQVTHITKFIGDWYLARVYMAAFERFALDRWRASVESRLAQLDEIYGVVQSEAYEQRMLLLEVAIVVLFIIDILALFLWK